MSLLRSIFCRVARPYTCLVVPKFTGPMVNIAHLHTSIALRADGPEDLTADKKATGRINLFPEVPKVEEKAEEVVVKEDTADVAAQADSSAVVKPLPREGVQLSEDYWPGKYFPTDKTYDMMFDGVRFDELPSIYIQVTRNNTKGNCYTFDRKPLAYRTAGLCGFKNTNKKTNVAAQAVGLSIGQTLLRKGVKNVRVDISGIGTTRLAAIKGVQLSGINIVAVSDKTHPRVNMRPRGRKNA